jgi:hypothetical protein
LEQPLDNGAAGRIAECIHLRVWVSIH